MLQCRTCGGTYEPLQADGLLYFHVCPPLSAAELQAAVDAGLVALPDGETAEDAVARRSYERKQRRDENVKGGHRDNAHEPRAEGAGVIEITRDVAPATVVVDVPIAGDTVQP